MCEYLSICAVVERPSGYLMLDTVGEAPNRIVVAQWLRAKNAHTGNLTSFQAQIFNGSSAILFPYADFCPRSTPRPTSRLGRCSPVSRIPLRRQRVRRSRCQYRAGRGTRLGIHLLVADRSRAQGHSGVAVPVVPAPVQHPVSVPAGAVCRWRHAGLCPLLGGASAAACSGATPGIAGCARLAVCAERPSSSAG